MSKIEELRRDETRAKEKKRDALRHFSDARAYLTACQEEEDRASDAVIAELERIVADKRNN